MLISINTFPIDEIYNTEYILYVVYRVSSFSALNTCNLFSKIDLGTVPFVLNIQFVALDYAKYCLVLSLDIIVNGLKRLCGTKETEGNEKMSIF